jgi:NADH:ubiquinone oxidoreductase subunit F (NADH-binding)/NAD-dependent dihydropyrimidine dehydrogenase PreA subunit
MSDRIVTRCCDKCWHTAEKPCHRFVECITEGPLCHDDPACKDARQASVRRFLRDDVETPVVFLGAGTCGLGAGAAKTKEAILTWCAANNIAITLKEVGCIGLCTAEPLVDIQIPGRARISFHNVHAAEVPAVFGGVFTNKIPSSGVLGQYRHRNAAPWEGVDFLDCHPFFAPQTRWVLENCGIVDPTGIGDYLARGGYRALSKALSSHTPEECCSIVETSGLRGRGGGGFPAAKKWKIAHATPSDQKYFICNADEGDPGAFMDRAVIEGDPHRVLEGLAIAAYAIGATKAIVYIRAEYPLAIARLRQAITEAAELGLVGYNVLDSGASIDIAIKQGAGAFVCGEETALMHSIEGKRGMPRLRPPFPAVSGLYGKPTIINNVETLANVPAIIARGASWFNAVGTAGSKGTKVFAVSGNVTRTGLVEIAMGTTVRHLVMEICGGVPDNRRLKAVQIGGPSGGCIPESNLDIQIDYESLKTVGAIMGSGGLVVMDERTCMVDVAKFFMSFIQRESCGKCIPCREGTRRMLEILTRITSNTAGSNVAVLQRFKGMATLEELARVIADTSLCGLGQTAPNPVLSTLRWFRDEYETHLFERRCPSRVCTELTKYVIDIDKCTGCTACVKKCPSGAIKGAVKSPHYIISEKCIGCGACAKACRFAAIAID